MKLLLINPVTKEKWRNHLISVFPPLNLTTIASHTPGNWEIKIVDETIQRLDLEEQVDLIGISCLTINAPRAYEIAQKFRSNGAKVVLGGLHPSMLPDEAIRYCDVVVIGEAEGIWENLIDDFENNRLKKFYYGSFSPLVNLPLPRRDLLSKRYVMDSIETSRGCPMACKFCSVSKFNGKLFRQRPVKEVLNEIGTIRKKMIFFTDSNILGYGAKVEDRAINLFKGLRGHNKLWLAQASINIAENDKVLKYAAESGCYLLYIGFESVNELALKGMGKVLNLRTGVTNYKKVIEKIHDYGIMVYGAFIVGNDGDDKSIFKKTLDFVYDSGIDIAGLSVLTPLPGTDLYNELNKERRLLYTNYPADWSRYMDCQITFKPRNMSVEQISEGNDWFVKELFSTRSSLKRTIKSIAVARRPRLSFLLLLYNLIMRHYNPK